ncbi:MAG: hypothetical protein K8S24_00320 [Candidatus Aegiribacteria sp.]|nr:hypothetical protein [Candidatus Aegiribacteria sp.]
MKKNKRGGSVLVLVMIAAVVLTILVGAVYMLFESNARSQQWAKERIQARFTAEAGANLAVYMIMEGADVPQGGIPVRLLPDSSLTDDWIDLGGELGWVQAWVDPHDENDQVSAANAYEVRVLSKVISEDQVHSYCIGTMILPRNFAQYATFLNDGGGGSGGWYGDNYRFDGPFHTNTSVNIGNTVPGRDSSDPWFYSISIVENVYYYVQGGYTPTSSPQIGNLWLEPYEKMLMGEPYLAFGVDPIPFGSGEVTWQGAYNAASSGGLMLNAATVPNGTRMILRDSTLIVKQDSAGAAVQYDLSTLTNPVVWVDNAAADTVYLKGILTDPLTTGLSIALTIGVSGSMGMSGSLLYQNRDLLDTDNDVMLGIVVRNGSFVVADDPSWKLTAPLLPDWDDPWKICTFNVASLEFDGVIMVLDGEFRNQEYKPGHWPSPAIDLRIVGGYIINTEGWTTVPGPPSYGYWSDIVYDPRLMSMHPPFYPQTGIWDTAYWEEEEDIDENNIGDTQQ